MYVKGTNLYINANLRACNIRTAPNLKAPAIRIGKTGDPAGGKFVGKFKSSVKVEGLTFIQLDYKEPRWIDSQLVTDTIPGTKTGETLWAIPGKTARLFASITAKEPVLQFTGYQNIGNLARVYKSGSTTFYVVTKNGYPGELYVNPNEVLTNGQIERAYTQAIRNDELLYKSALIVQDRILIAQKKGERVDAANKALGEFMERYKKRQEIYKSLAPGNYQFGSGLKGATLQLYDKLSKSMGLSAIPWIVIGIVILVGGILGAVISVAIYKSWFENKLTSSSSVDLEKMEEFRQRLDGASTPEDRKKVFDQLTNYVNDYGKKQFDEGADSSDNGFLSNLGDGLGKAVIFGVVGFVGFQAVKGK